MLLPARTLLGQISRLAWLHECADRIAEEAVNEGWPSVVGWELDEEARALEDARNYRLYRDEHGSTVGHSGGGRLGDGDARFAQTTARG